MSTPETALPRFDMLTRQQCERVHSASLEVLRRTGVRVYHEEARKLLAESGSARVDNEHVWLQPGIVEWALAQAPSRIPLCRRGGTEVIAALEGRTVCFGTGSDCLTYLDPRSGALRPFTLQDVVDCVRVVDALPEMQFCMSMGIPHEVQTSPYRAQFAIMLRNTVKPIVFVCNDRLDCEAIVAMAAAAAGGLDRLRMNPNVLLYAEPSSPLRHSQTAVAKLLYMAEQLLPVVYSPAPVQGGTAPVTLAGALAMANAEVLSGLVVHQLKRPGAPFVYGQGMHQLDMLTTISVYTSPEFALARVAVAELGRFYGLPTWGYAGDANACVVDEQASAEATFSILVSLLSGCNLTHDVGYLESGKTFSSEMVVLCDEIISMSRAFMRGISFNDESMAMDVVDSAGPGGTFLETDHTFANFRSMWRPALFNRLGGEAWTRAGSKRTGDHLRDRTVALIESHEPEPLPADVDQEIESILKESRP
ncbi:MAG: trimethylamine methyltransferase family protein [Armatimonadota bacterium]